MSGQRNAYGTSLFCFCRRNFVVAVCLLLSVSSIVSLVAFAYVEGAFEEIFGSTVHKRIPGCSGYHCYEVFSCEGLRESTHYLHQPWVALCGSVFFSLGFYGSIYSARWALRYTLTYIVVIVPLFVILFLADRAYSRACSEFPTNLVKQCLVWGPVSPVGLYGQKKLKAMSVYPQASVQELVGNLDVMTWYFLISLGRLVFLVYLGREVSKLADVVQHGPLGIGLNFGLDQWDETLNWEALQYRRAFAMPSAFAKGGELPEYGASLFSAAPQTPAGYRMPMQPSYGATLDLGEVGAEVYGAVAQFIPEDVQFNPRGLVFGEPVTLEEVKERARLDMEEREALWRERANGKDKWTEWLDA